MSLAAIKDAARKSESAYENERAQREERFRYRLAAQQFLKHQAPLFRVMLAKGRKPEEIGASREFADMTIRARELAMVIARSLFPDLEAAALPEAARHFRVEAAEAVAMAWADGRDLDIDFAAETIADAVRQAHIVFDGEAMRWRDISEAGSISLSAAASSALLLRSVMLYDFRLGRDNALSRLSTLLVETTSENVRAILPGDASFEDRRSVFQSVMRENGQILAGIYESISRRTVAALAGQPEADRQSWLLRERPLDAIEVEFRAAADALSLAAARIGKLSLDALKTAELPPTPSP